MSKKEKIMGVDKAVYVVEKKATGMAKAASKAVFASVVSVAKAASAALFVCGVSVAVMAVSSCARSGWTSAELDIICGSGGTGSGYIGSEGIGSGDTGSGYIGSGETGSGDTGFGYIGSEGTSSGETGSGETMRVLTVNVPGDSIVLRKPCEEIEKQDLKGEVYRCLVEKMIATVTSPEQDGVGIAGPQVGISRRVVAVQRFDKEGEPFEAYPNIKIIECRGEKVPGGEGCLSIPGKRGVVARYRDIDICYTSVRTLQDTVESVKGFTAVIFQHECDHLDGVLYTDYLFDN